MNAVTRDLPLIGRAAEVRADAIDREARRIEIVWTTGATVQRVRWEGWDDRIEYDEELAVDPVSVRLERLNSGAPFLNSHSSWRVENVLGSIVPGSVRLENGKGFASVQLTGAADAAGIVERILDGSVRSVSVGYRVHKYEITKATGKREHWRAVDWEPFEVSAVPIPADPGAHIRAEEQSSGGSALAPCVLIRQDVSAAAAAPSKGQTMTTPNPAAAGDTTDAQRGATPPANPSASPPAAPPAPDADAIRAEERARVAEIDRLCQRHGMDAAFREEQIRTGAAVAVVRERILDKLAASDPAGRTVESAPAQARNTAGEIAYRDAVCGALLHRYAPGSNPLAAESRDFRGLTLIDLARHSLERLGTSTRGMGRMEIADLALTRASSYHSTSDFPAILANVANKTLRDAYQSTPRTFAAWARRATIVDFKPVSRVQLGGAPNLERVLESGEFSYGTMGEGREVYGLVSYGRIVSVTRQVLINDDLDAFTRVPAAFGASAADLESDIVYSILIDNPLMSDNIALFATQHGNLGTAAVINEASIRDAYRLFAQQRGLEGRLISILPQFIIVPPGARSVEARKQMTSTTPSNTAEVNPFAGRMQIIEEPRLIPAAGQDPWFLAADPSRIDTVEYAYLEGQEGVYTETRMGFQVDGVEIKARADFAAKAIDWRGMFRNPGAAPV